MAGAVRVRTMTPADFPWAIALTDTEAWGYAAADFERLSYLEPGGVFVAEADGARVGITAVTAYGALAYLGAVVVEPSWRGQGVGQALLHACFEFADDRGVESLRLNAYENVVPYYERLGFRSEFENLRFSGTGEGRASAQVRPARRADLAALAALDLRYFGADRTRLLARLVREFPPTALVFSTGDEVVAYAVGNTSAETCEIGPFVCPPERAPQAEELLQASFHAANAPCAFSLPAANRVGVAAARGSGLRETFRTVRMVRGSSAHGGDPRGIFALGGLEKG